jgi:hypothetical protein
MVVMWGYDWVELTVVVMVVLMVGQWESVKVETMVAVRGTRLVAQ